MKKVLIVLALAAVLNVVALVHAASQQAVRIETGLVSGVTDSLGVTSYKGIPFAAPPVGNLRWQAPQPAAHWDGVRKANRFGNACVQIENHSRLPWTEPFMEQGPVSEDCLYLNVWTAAKSAAERRPVMVWIYGGGFNEGAASIAAYDGTQLAHRGVVLVSMNYRVRAFGYLAHPELSKKSGHGVSGNYGLLDQIAAIQWVHKNIAAFGGDPSRVTIFGQSAGAMSVYDVMQSPLAQGLFARAIIESGPGLFAPSALGGTATLADREQAGLRWAESKGAHSLADLRALSAEQILAAAPGGAGPGPTFSPFPDGYVLPAHGSSPAKQVPFIVGMVADDLGVGPARTQGGSPTVAAFQSAQQKKYGVLAGDFFRLYPVSADADVLPTEKAVSRDQARVSIDLWAADQMKSSPRVYTYYFSRAIPWPEHPEFGAFHTSEVPYVFENLAALDRPWEPVDRKVSDTISSYWINFAATGDPNAKGLPAWPNYSPDAHVTMEIGAQTGKIPVASPDQIAFHKAYLLSSTR